MLTHQEAKDKRFCFCCAEAVIMQHAWPFQTEGVVHAHWDPPQPTLPTAKRPKHRILCDPHVTPAKPHEASHPPPLLDDSNSYRLPVCRRPNAMGMAHRARKQLEYKQKRDRARKRHKPRPRPKTPSLTPQPRHHPATGAGGSTPASPYGRFSPPSTHATHADRKLWLERTWRSPYPYGCGRAPGPSRGTRGAPAPPVIMFDYPAPDGNRWPCHPGAAPAMASTDGNLAPPVTPQRTTAIPHPTLAPRQPVTPGIITPSYGASPRGGNHHLRCSLPVMPQ